MHLMYAITPVAGFLKNYVKYKRVNMAIFSRTPVMYLCIDRLLSYFNVKDIVLWTLILERWFFFYAKICLSYWRGTYTLRKQKYIQKYGLCYTEDKKLFG
jgi:hypothetical protein